MAEPVVSIICETYNHESYIRTCLDSLLAQETRYPFEIIVHDDASTDSTPTIVAEYSRLHPGIIRPILQEENQLSQGRNPFDLACQIAEGKYIACCEGDDFWLDPNKLEMQVGYLEEHPSCTFCFTNAKYFDDAGSSFTGTLLPGNEKEARILSRDRAIDVVDMLQIEFIPTASFIFPRWAYDQRPIFPRPAFDGDRYLQMVMTEAGEAHYMDAITTAYRINNSSSMMEVWRRNNQKMYEGDVEFLHFFLEFDAYTKGRYEKELMPWIMRWDYAAARHSGDARRVRQAKFWRYARQKGGLEVPVYLLTCVSPSLFLATRAFVRSLPRLSLPKRKK
ncbi:glycosyltransferase [Actinomycetaceae bacterium L2_0104]